MVEGILCELSLVIVVEVSAVESQPKSAPGVTRDLAGLRHAGDRRNLPTIWMDPYHVSRRTQTHRPQIASRVFGDRDNHADGTAVPHADRLQRISREDVQPIV